MAIIITQPDGKPIIGNKVHFVHCAKGINERAHAEVLLRNYPEGTTFEITSQNIQECIQLYEQNRKEELLKQIVTLEAKVTARLVREATLGSKEAINKLTEINDAITALRVKL